MAKKNLTKPLDPEMFVEVQSRSFDNAFTDMDNPGDAAITQFGNGETLVKNDNPDDLEDKLVYGIEQ